MSSSAKKIFFSSSTTAIIKTALVSLPVAIWMNDTFLKLCKVKGRSMEPTLYDGDIVVIRSADGFWQRWTKKQNDITPSSKMINGEDGFGDGDDDFDNDDGDGDGDDRRWSYERRRVLEYEGEHCNVNPIPDLILRCPPIPVTGDIVVFQDPTTYFPNNSWNIKRVIGLGGQMVLVPFDDYYKNDDRDRDSDHRRNNDNIDSDTHNNNNKNDNDNSSHRRFHSLDEYRTGMRIATTSVPPYSLWVEGDNKNNSYDSRTRRRRSRRNIDYTSTVDVASSGGHGPVSKKLLIGIAEYRIWPPWRIGKLPKHSPSWKTTRQQPYEGNGDSSRSSTNHVRYEHPQRPRAYWPY